MEKKIEIIPFLAGIVKGNTRTYQSDLTFDEKRLQAAMLEGDRENRTFVWMCRPCGTWCFLEREVFLRDTEAFLTWTYEDYIAQADQIKACRITVDPGYPGEFVLGKVQPLDYGEQVERVMRLALPIHQVALTFDDGETRAISYRDYMAQYHGIHSQDNIQRIDYLPENEGELTSLLYLERHPPKQGSRRPKTPTTR